MSEQLPLPGFSREERRDRLFFAVVPSIEDRPRIAQLATRLRQDCGLRGRPIGAARFHVSLHALGDYSELPEQVVDAATDAGSAVAARGFAMAFDCAMSFYTRERQRPFVLRAGDDMTALEDLHKGLGEAMARKGLGRWVAPGFTPHMTLLYDHRLVPETGIDTVRIRAGELVLVHSLLQRSRHVHLARWPLHG